MTTEQKEATDLVKCFTKKNFSNENGWTGYYDTELKELQQAIEIVLNLIQEQEKEVEVARNITKEMNNDVKKLITECKKKKRIIDLMAKKLNQAYFDEDKFCIWFEKMMGVQQKMDYGYVVDLIKQYFERKVEDEKN